MRNIKCREIIQEKNGPKHIHLVVYWVNKSIRLVNRDIFVVKDLKNVLQANCCKRIQKNMI